MTTLAQFMQTLVDDAFQGSPPTREQNDTELAVIVNARGAAHKTPRRESIDQTHSAVMPEKQALRQAADAGLVRIR
ncbi:MAG: hypothetical protein WB627_09065 [Candidatus Acidiferrum sp.]